MKLLKKINNNFALAIDEGGKKVIVEGKGIGFNKIPCVVDDLSKIDRTYYDFDEKYMYLIDSLSQEVIDTANKIYKKFISVAECEVNENLPFILADHINFAIERHLKGIDVKMPLYYDLKQMFPLEYQVSLYGLKVIKQMLNVTLPIDEVSGIMLNIINAEVNNEKTKKVKDYEKRNQKITDIIERVFNISLSKDSFNYSRFLTHMNYLYERAGNKSLLNSGNKDMYQAMVKQYPKTDICVENISAYLKSNYGLILNEEEKLYLILHINRLCERELGL